MIQHIFKIHHPTTCFIVGPTQAGKTEFVIQLLKERNDLISPAPDRIYWAYGQKNEKQLTRIHDIEPSITFSEGFPDVNSFDPQKNNLLILDDLMDEIGKNKECANLFTRGSHHNNITVIAIIHNIYNQEKYSRTLTLNGRLFVFFDSPRDRLQYATFGRQAFPQHKNFFTSALNQIFSMNPFAYAVLNLDPKIPESLRLCTNIFKNQIPIFFVPQFTK
jgi:hypothetical protein